MSPPTVIVPQRPEGLAALDLDEGDLDGVTVLQPAVQRVLPHDRTAVTEGLTLLDDERIVESTGFYGRSSRRVIALDEGNLGVVVRLQPEFYGSGIAILSGTDPVQGIHFTRFEERVLRFDGTDLSLLATERFGAEVTGACSLSPDELAVSTSEADIQLVSTASLEVRTTISPTAGSARLPALTDLSCRDGAIWGVVGETGVLAVVNAETGAVESLADLAALTPAGLASTDVLSGLAFRPSSETWFVTGKRWDVLYEITLGS
ncbi:MAG: glutaminyl-peptide cyclotransferase [Acidimicrobiia bacterium]|nr:glutaminyl-peptide cyclotransferase [Acidimicrobiia bacterium]